MQTLYDYRPCWASLGALLAGALVLTGCADSGLPTLADPEAPRFSVSPASDAVEQAALAELTRAVAMTLADESIRRRVGRDMGSSRVREHKLEFSRYLHGQSGGVLLAQMERRSGLDRDSLQALLSTVRPLEFYMPVRAHRRTWTGDDHLLVAASVDDASVIAFDLRGARVFVSTSAAPATPTLVLVPIETDFAAVDAAGESSIVGATGGPVVASPSTTGATSMGDDPECDPETVIIPCDEEGTGSYGPFPPGVAFTKLQIRDTHEPWIRGGPEIDMVFSGTVVGGYVPSFNVLSQQWSRTYDPNMRRLVYADCAGEDALGYRRFNADGGTFVGGHDVLVAKTENFAVTEEIYDPTNSLIVGRRLVRLMPPFRLELMERDDGSQCPTPPKTYTLDFGVQFRFNGFPIRLQRFGWADANALFGNNNDQIATFLFDSFAELESLNNTFRSGTDADAWFTNRGFNRNSVPAAQDPWNGQ